MMAAFLAPLVEFIEALTVVLAVGAVRGWSGPLGRAGAGFALLFALVALLRPALALIQLNVVQLFVGALLLLFGMRWLRKAILRAAGVIALHDKAREFAHETKLMQWAGRRARGLDKVAFFAAFKITMLEGIEVVFIAVAVSAGGAGLLLPARRPAWNKDPHEMASVDP